MPPQAENRQCKEKPTEIQALKWLAVRNHGQPDFLLTVIAQKLWISDPHD
jgi:hypothetical protein